MRSGAFELRVVILAGDPYAGVAVVELPPAAGPGTVFDYRGCRWEITDSRPRTRVLMARPAP